MNYRYTKKEYLAYAVLRFVYGNISPTKYGSSHGILNKPVTNSGALGVLTGFSSTYTDSGLVGFFLVADAKSAPKVSRKFGDRFKSGDLGNVKVMNNFRLTS